LQLTVRSSKWVRLPLELCIRRDIQWKTTYLLIDENGKSMQFFQDTLFIGDVEDQIWLKAASMTQEQLAGILFNSLRTK
jgi:hypothetical protein